MLSICKVMAPAWLLHCHWNAVAVAKAAKRAVVEPYAWSKLAAIKVTAVQVVGATKLEPQ
jgi:hypothetical protein